jgi:signal transduction histidine kinase
LQSFVREQADGQSDRRDSDWQLAIASTKRMEDLINRVVRVLQEDESGASYELSLEELAEMLSVKAQTSARQLGVRFAIDVSGSAVFSNRQAGLLELILQNLIENALEATPAGKAVRLVISAEPENVIMEVQDEGSGLSREVQSRLFSPCASHKQGGSGIGLAISHQLANHLDAKLELKRSSQQGCTFRLTLPRTSLLPNLSTIEGSEDCRSAGHAKN